MNASIASCAPYGSRHHTIGKFAIKRDRNGCRLCKFACAAASQGVVPFESRWDTSCDGPQALSPRHAGQRPRSIVDS
ncbi:hypothetical protein Naga_100118g1 [Nannochloropsis gaditana]|uniref:Uncharacterized protein n=1 Tax=Nannochloropsis gaditana TaxID=72520 RepID=W7TNL6_9STRA|nr:hypothetical protein Naga_100118g1 [Nannochloropsis gaditana]